MQQLEQPISSQPSMLLPILPVAVCVLIRPASLAPLANVQIELYNQGYYSGPIDGILGPDTQAAIADYQADYGLPVTAGIDEPTVESLGLV